MTLNTSVFLPPTKDISGTFETALTSLLWMAADHDHPSIQIEIEPRRVLTVVGQGLPAWTWLHHDPKGFKELPESFIEQGVVPRSLGVRIDFDTAYGAEFEFPGTDIPTLGCSQIHGLVIRDLSETMDLWWVNEFTDEGFHSVDGLADFMKPDRYSRFSEDDVEELYRKVKNATSKPEFVIV